MHLASAVLRGEEGHAQQRLEMGIHERLESLLDGDRLPGQRMCTAFADAEDLDVAHSATPSPRTSILPVTAAEMSAARYSLSLSMCWRTLDMRASSLVDSCSRKAAIARCSDRGGKGTPNLQSMPRVI